MGRLIAARQGDLRKATLAPLVKAHTSAGQ